MRRHSRPAHLGLGGLPISTRSKLSVSVSKTTLPSIASSGVLGGKSLVSVAINGSSTARFDAKGDSAVQADFSVTNLVTADPKGKALAPLAVQFILDGAARNQVVDLKVF